MHFHLNKKIDTVLSDAKYHIAKYHIAKVNQPQCLAVKKRNSFWLHLHAQLSSISNENSISTDSDNMQLFIFQEHVL